MASRNAWPIDVAGVGPVAVGSVLWGVHGQLNATVIVKACFALSPDAPMTVVAPEPIRQVRRPGQA